MPAEAQTVDPDDRLARALTMLGRIVKTTYILRYLQHARLVRARRPGIRRDVAVNRHLRLRRIRRGRRLRGLRLRPSAGVAQVAAQLLGGRRVPIGKRSDHWR